MPVRLLLTMLVAASSLALVPVALAQKTPAPLASSAPAASSGATAFLPTVFGDGMVAGANFSLDLGQHAGARAIYYDPGQRLLFHDRTISKVLWGTNSVRVTGVGTLNGKRVTFVIFAVDGGDVSNGIFTLSVNGRAALGGPVAEGAVTIG